MADTARTELLIRVRLVQNALRFFRLLRGELGLLRHRVNQNTSAFANFMRMTRRLTSVLVAFYIIRRIFTGIRDAISRLIKTASDLEERLLVIKGMLGATRAETVLFGVDLTRLSIRYGKSVNELSDTMISLIRAGFQGRKQLREMVSVVTEFELATDNASQAQRDLFLRMGKAFGLETAGQYYRLGDVLAHLETQVVATSEEILKMTRMLAAGRATNQMTIQQALSLSATFLDVGNTFRTTGFQINKFYGLLADVTKQETMLRAVTKELGSEFADTLQTTEDASEQLTIFVMTLQAMSKSEQVAFMKKLGVEGNRFKMTMDTLNMALERNQRLQQGANEVAEKGGVLQKRFEAVMEGFNRQWDRFKNALSAVKRTLATPLLEPLTKRIRHMADVIEKTDWEQQIKNFADAWKGVGENVKKAYDAFVDFLPALTRFLKITIAAFVAWKALTIGIGVAGTVIGVAMTAISGLSMVMASPAIAGFAAVILGIAAAITVLTGGLILALPYIWQLGKVWGIVVDAMGEQWGRMVDFILDKLEDGINTMLKGIKKLSGPLQPFFTLIGQRQAGIALSSLPGSFEFSRKQRDWLGSSPLGKIPEINKIGKLAAKLEGRFMDILESYGGAWTDMIGEWVSWMKTKFGDALKASGLDEFFNWTMDFVEQFLGPLGEFLPQGGGDREADTTREDQLERLARVFGSGLADMLTSVRNFKEGASALFQGLLGELKARFIDKFVEKFMEAFNPLNVMIDKLATMLADVVGKIVQQLMKMALGPFGGIFGFQHGTPYVQETGLAYLHKGEAVIPAHMNRAGLGGTTNISININGSADAHTVRDIEYTIRKTMKDLDRKRYGRNRQLAFVR